jgi:hypothetical protein
MGYAVDLTPGARSAVAAEKIVVPALGAGTRGGARAGPGIMPA